MGLVRATLHEICQQDRIAIRAHEPLVRLGFRVHFAVALVLVLVLVLVLA